MGTQSIIKDVLSIAILQYDIVWENKRANYKKIQDLLERNSDHFDMVVLPEMFATGFSMNTSALSESMDGESIKFLTQLSNQYNCSVCGSLMVKEEDKVYNRWIWVNQEEIVWYDKRHLFAMGNENKYYSPGMERILISFRGWKILPQICYDLRFPVWSRNDLYYDILIYVANWPAARKNVWEILLKARAIENQCYVLACNRTGGDGMGISYVGGSMVIDAKGKIKDRIDNKEGVIFLELSKSSLDGFRDKFPVLNDLDQFEIKN